jgi:hypothetical protein
MTRTSHFGAAQEAFRATLAGASLASLMGRSQGLDPG